MPLTIRVTHEVRLDPRLSNQFDKLIEALADDVDLARLKAAVKTNKELRAQIEGVLAENPPGS